MSKPYAIVIEDDPKLSTIYMTALQHAGFDVALDMNGDQYQSLMSETDPILVILDLHLPFASGSEILPVIRERWPRAIVAVVTADLVKARSLPVQADYVLIKPLSVARLLKIAASAMNGVTDIPTRH